MNESPHIPAIVPPSASPSLDWTPGPALGGRDLWTHGELLQVVFREPLWPPSAMIRVHYDEQADGALMGDMDGELQPWHFRDVAWWAEVPEFVGTVTFYSLGTITPPADVQG